MEPGFPAHYECHKCKTRFTTMDAGVGTVCVFCGHHYLTWLNHPSILERKTKDANR